MRQIRNAYKISFRKPEGKRLLGRPRNIWKEQIKMTTKYLVCNNVDCIQLFRFLILTAASMKMAERRSKQRGMNRIKIKTEEE
jgi:hypothetical protein